jgi:hypothetical protein
MRFRLMKSHFDEQEIVLFIPALSQALIRQEVVRLQLSHCPWWKGKQGSARRDDAW